MREFRKYEKIHRLGKEETDGILFGLCYIQEKIDGANTSIWLGEDRTIQAGSRNRHLVDDDFNGFVEYIKNHQGIVRFFNDYPEARLYGEWLVKHTIQYKETAYRKFYLFDVHNGYSFFSPKLVTSIGFDYQIETVPMIAEIDNPSIDQLKEMVGKSSFGERGEGVVIKNMNFTNKFGECVYAKIVHESFKEKNLLTMSDNDKYLESYNEIYFVNKYMTLQRVRKVTEKIQPEVNEKLDMKHIPRICGTAYHDMLTEEIWEASKKVPSVNFKTLKNLAMKKAKIIYVDLLNDA